MKKFALSIVVVICGFTASTQPIFTYGKYSVSKDEFLRAYNKNKSAVADKEQALREYLELYSNFKLKVQAAKDLHLDTLPQLDADVESFRRQVDENYMNDEKATQKLTEQAFDRSLVNLHTIHFSVAISPEANPEDSLKAYQLAQSLFSELRAGKTDYQNLAERLNAKYGDLGFITVFTLPYQYENIVYSLKPGQASNPYRSSKSWHIFKVLEQRKDIGSWRVAQILFTYPPDANAGLREAVQKKADSIYKLLQKGADFAALARDFSDDKLTYQNGGELPEFSSGKFDHSFEEKVFALQKDNDVAAPFTTSFGIHIVKRLGHTALISDRADAAKENEIRKKVLQDARITETKEKFAKDIRAKIGFKRLPGVADKDLLRFADSLNMHPEPEYIAALPLASKPIIGFTAGTLKVADWLKFAGEYKSNFDQYKGETSAEIWEKYLTISALEYYRKKLEVFNPEFRAQMLEFREGNMLFEVMERNVWAKAGADSIGLQQYYDAHKTQYKWGASADVLIINGTSEQVTTQVLADLKAGQALKDILAERSADVQADSSRYELSQINGASESFKPGADGYSPVVRNPDGTATFIRYYKFYEPDQQRSFQDARGLVINDYQNVLEKRWLDELRKKYPVKVNETVFKTTLK